MQPSRIQPDPNGAKSRHRKGRICSPSSFSEQPQPQKTISELFASSKHKSTDQIAVSSRKRQKTEHVGSTEDISSVQIGIIKPENMYTFSSSSPPRNGIIELTNSPSASPRKSSISQRRPTNFGPHSGTKKLVVKNFRTTSNANPDRYYNNVCSQLDNALSAIFRHEKISLEELYRGVENICRQDRAPALFLKLYERCQTHAVADFGAPLVEAAANGTCIGDLLRAVLKAWATWKDELVRTACALLGNLYRADGFRLLYARFTITWTAHTFYTHLRSHL